MALTFLCITFASWILSTIAADSYPPEQIHIALGQTPDTIAFTYQTNDYPIKTTANVRIGESASSLNRNVSGETYLFVDPNSDHTKRTLHVVNVTGLKPSTRYYYKVGDEQYGWSTQTFTFKTIWDSNTLKENLPQKFLILGDLGDTNNQVLSAVINESTIQNQVDVLIHVGDIAYNMDSNQGKTGDTFMNQIQGTAAYTPYMVCPGNHEAAFNFSHYSQKFRGQPANAGTVWTTSGETPNNWYFSYNAGMVHFVSISTEIYFDFPYMISEQWNWVQQDLIEANKNRTEAPWIVVYGHKPLYCSSVPDSDCDSNAYKVRNGVQNKTTKQYQYGMEQLFYEQGVDFYICGHEHNYERMYDIYKNKTTRTTKNMPSTTYVVTGSAGCDEGKEGFQTVQPDWSAFRTQDYSYTRFYVYNSSHIHMQQVTSDSTIPSKDNHMVIDDTWYIQPNHGPFKDNLKKGLLNTKYHDDAQSVTVLKPGPDRGPRDEELHIEYISDDKEDYRGVEGVYF